MSTTGVAVEKLARFDFAKTAPRQEALQTIFPTALDIFYHPIFNFPEKPTLSTATGIITTYLDLPRPRDRKNLPLEWFAENFPLDCVSVTRIGVTDNYPVQIGERPRLLLVPQSEFS